MNNENNNLNNGQNISSNDKFMPVSDINQINQPVMNNPQVVPSSQPVLTQQPVMQTPVVQPMPEPVTQPVIQPTPMTQPQVGPTPTTGPQMGTDNNTMVNENLKKVEIKNYSPPSKFKMFVLILFFIGLVAFIIFLPDISTMINLYTSGEYKKEETKITTGKLICKLNTNTSELDKNYEFTFTFEDSKLKKIKYIADTRGDSSSEALLNEQSEKCNALKEATTDIEEFYIRCDYTDGELIETQNIDLETLENEKLSAAFTEAGGILPTYNYDQNIDDIESNMKASDYTCVRER